jgi:oxygen-independent coproporphyrinogen-3 oxidase
VNHGEKFTEKEVLREEEKFDEYIMLSLRTIWGADTGKIERDFGADKKEYFLSRIKNYVLTGHVAHEGNIFRMTPPGWLISDYIMSSLMHS